MFVSLGNTLYVMFRYLGRGGAEIDQNCCYAIFGRFQQKDRYGSARKFNLVRSVSQHRVADISLPMLFAYLYC